MKRPREDPSTTSHHPSSKKQRLSSDAASRPFRPRPRHPRISSESTAPTSTAHTKKSRRSNPSTRIHSLRNLLSRDVLPPDQRRDRERELSALLFDQQKSRIEKETRVMVQRYHMVRFFERRKAERKLKRLVREKREITSKYDGPEKEIEELERLVHEAEVDVNYTIYSPLAEKYIGIFVDVSKDGRAPDKEKVKNKIAKSPLGKIEEEKMADLRECAVEMANIAHVGTKGVKPPLWDEVEKCMEGDDEKAVKRRLEALRDRKPKMLEGLAVRANGKMEKMEKKPAWLDEDGHIDKEDLNSDEDVEMGGNSEDEDDGGFFER